MTMIPPKTINVLDKHDGFTAVTLSPTYIKIIKDPVKGERETTMEDYQPTLIHPFVRWRKVMREYGTVWRPSRMLKHGSIGTLNEYDEHSFYQNNNNATKALYKVPGYRFRIAVWFDNTTGERIA